MFDGHAVDACRAWNDRQHANQMYFAVNRVGLGAAYVELRMDVTFHGLRLGRDTNLPVCHLIDEAIGRLVDNGE